MNNNNKPEFKILTPNLNENIEEEKDDEESKEEEEARQKELVGALLSDTNKNVVLQSYSADERNTKKVITVLFVLAIIIFVVIIIAVCVKSKKNTAEELTTTTNKYSALTKYNSTNASGVTTSTITTTSIPENKIQENIKTLKEALANNEEIDSDVILYSGLEYNGIAYTPVEYEPILSNSSLAYEDSIIKINTNGYIDINNAFYQYNNKDVVAVSIIADSETEKALYIIDSNRYIHHVDENGINIYNEEILNCIYYNSEKKMVLIRYYNDTYELVENVTYNRLQAKNNN